MVSSNFPNRPFQLRENVWVISQDTNPAAPKSYVGWQLWIDKTGYSPTYSGGKAVRRMILAGIERGYADNPGFDFRGGGPWLILSGEAWVNHNSDGTLRMNIEGHADYDLLGATAVYSYLDLPPIPVYGPPNPPINGQIYNIEKTTFTYQFVYGGGVVTRYDVRWATKPDYSDATEILGVSGTGIVPFSGLRPGTMYYVQSRAVNDRGESAWGADASARTRSGAWISDGTKWVPADVFISDGTKWLPADVLISDGSKWGPTA